MNWKPSRQFTLELLAIIILVSSTIVTAADLGLPRPALAWLGVVVLIAKALEHRYQQAAVQEAHDAPSPLAAEHIGALLGQIDQLQRQNERLRQLAAPDALYPASPPSVPDPPDQGVTLPAWRKDE